MELLNVLDNKGNVIGVLPKEEVHKKGLWHQVFACLLIDSDKNTVYLQYKNAKHDPVEHRNKIDISVGGHLIHGETVKDGVREIKEETGLSVTYSDLTYVGLRKVDVKPKKDYIIREFNYLHIYDSSFSLQNLKSDDDEVLYFIEFSIDDLIEFLEQPMKIVGRTPMGFEEFTAASFIKGYMEEDQFYLKYLKLAKELIRKKKAV